MLEIPQNLISPKLLNWPTHFQAKYLHHQSISVRFAGFLFPLIFHLMLNSCMERCGAVNITYGIHLILSIASELKFKYLKVQRFNYHANCCGHYHSVIVFMVRLLLNKTSWLMNWAFMHSHTHIQGARAPQRYNNQMWRCK